MCAYARETDNLS
uniref:Uncharacterized protein n=1 Tax=Anopheles quadriannulatus TaxID=34691 RepID=A0A182XS76_ANOQN